MNDSNFGTAINTLKAFFSSHELEIPLPQGGLGVAVIDPIAGKVIGSHYALSHYCAGLFLLSQWNCDNTISLHAEKCLSYIEATQDDYVQESDYHYDFNNFAWSLLLLADEEFPGLLPEYVRPRILELLFHTSDSSHDTVNWLAMRALNNFVRHRFSGDKRFLKTANDILKCVAKAQNSDGMYDDLLPLGNSGNIQYHVYTTAILQLLRYYNLSNGGGDLNRALAFTAYVIGPDGDFNYFGRGTNQIFGWGPYFFNLSGIDLTQEVYDLSKSFLDQNLLKCLSENGLLLDNPAANQYNYWWDYHYCTVYAAHLFFWLNLINTITPNKHTLDKDYSSSALKIISKNKFFCAAFMGKAHYLCEQGPQICYIATPNNGAIFKGPLGPFFDDFGNTHISKTMVSMNYFGPVTEYPEHLVPRIFPRRFLKIFRRLGFYNKYDSDFGVILRPIFPATLNISSPNSDLIEIEFILPKVKTPVSLNIPLFIDICPPDLSGFISAESEGRPLELFRVGQALGPYGEFIIYRSRPLLSARNILVKIISNSNFSPAR